MAEIGMPPMCFKLGTEGSAAGAEEGGLGCGREGDKERLTGIVQYVEFGVATRGGEASAVFDVTAGDDEGDSEPVEGLRSQVKSQYPGRGDRINVLVLV